ncbi:MAG TPA: VIT domain-containing protein [Gemmatimonadaceae bacterium]|nr:VIT domain-containing protein [Gemmatimonadaceae bacterium]
MRSVVRSSLYSFAIALSALPAYAQGWIIPRPCGAALMPADIRPGIPIRDCAPNIARTRSDVRVELADRVLRYEVEERFVNHGRVAGEADYLFPLPANAAFQDLKLSINGELVSGETMNAGDARRIYEQIVRTQRDPALVEWMGHGLLRARIFPLNPGEEKRIVVRFQSVAPREGDALRIDYFRAAAQSQTTVRDAGATSFTLTYRDTPDLGTPYSPTHSLDLTDRDGRHQAIVRGDARDVTLLVPVRRNNAAAISMLPYAPGNEDGFALVTVTPPPSPRNETTPRDITLVLDVSGSMQGRKMEQARAAGHQLLGTMRPDDRFRLIDFSSDVRTFRDEFVSATSANLRDAGRYLDALEAQGGTNIEGALREAVRPSTVNGRLPLVLFITDGEPTVGEQRPDRLASVAEDGSARSGTQRRIFTFGLGSDVNVSLLEQLAIGGRGTAQFVRPDESVERMVGVVANRLVDPVLTDVRVRIDGGDVRLAKILPAQPADVFADADLVVLARYSGHGSSRITVEGNRRGVPVRFTSNVDFPDRDRQNAFVARLWAAQRVGFLSAEKRKNSGGSEVDDEIRTLGERYGIPTEFTSYLVTEPQFVANRKQAMMSPAVAGGSAAMPVSQPASVAADSRAMRFEAAKTASAQRAMSSVGMLDSMSAVVNTAALARGAGSSTRTLNGRTFVLRDSVWTDARFTTTMPTTKIKPFSKVYFEIIDQVPELRAVFALGGRVTVVGRDRAIMLSNDGVSEMTSAALATLVKAW